MQEEISKSLTPSFSDLKQVKPWSIRTQAKIFRTISDLLLVGFSVRHAIRFCEVLYKPQLADLRWINEQLHSGYMVSQTFEPFVDDQIGLQLQLAEEHGQLTQSLGQISRLLQTAHQRHQKIKRLLQYPLILVAILAVIITGMKLVILPQIEALASTDHPHSTNWWWSIAVIPLILISICIYQAIRQQPILKRVEQTARIPILGPIVRFYYGYYFLATFTIMFEGGLGFQEILLTLRKAKTSTLLYQLGGKLETALAAGQPLPLVLAQFHFLPKELQMLFQSGKSQTDLVKELTALTALYYQRLTNRLEVMMTWIQPLSFILIGGVIIGAYASLFLPMYHTIGGL
ncbi:competence protein ComGB [Secundilactobacillus pentosiphilus]|uniref:Competence protein ComGB n=1 Tax=Secundilactobacillus pentosiphilus TaxID=1714682 RepID=A0A1Z5IPR1_9LACO|nr:type II secretion system F family protein [Secundilactobacillus pentosiphilus]GAX03735.1 competence protein ComGB [Secundilactobacillus pentosiphilus]